MVASLGSGEGSLPGGRAPTAHCVLTRQKKGERALGVSAMRALTPFMRALPSNHLPQSPPPDTIPLGIRTSI